MADQDEPLKPRYVDIEFVVDDAVDAARTVIECTLVPLREMLATLPAILDLDHWRSRRQWRRAGRFWRRRARRAAASWNG